MSEMDPRTATQGEYSDMRARDKHAPDEVRGEQATLEYFADNAGDER